MFLRHTLLFPDLLPPEDEIYKKNQREGIDCSQCSESHIEADLLAKRQSIKPNVERKD